MSDVEKCDDSEETKKCFESNDHLLDCLNIFYNESNSMFIFWNKYQIFLHEDHNFESASKTFVPEFMVLQLLASNNYLVCLDCSGNVHTTPLKFKNAAQKKFKSSFQTRDQGVLTITQYSSDTILSIKSVANTYFLCLNKMNAEFQVEKKIILKCEEHLTKPLTEVHVLYTCTVSKDDFPCVKDMFQIEDVSWKDHHIVLISFDKYNMYGCLFSSKFAADEIELVKLYTSPSEICDIKVVESERLYILVILVAGTLIRLPIYYKDQKPDVLHLNTAISKLVTFNSCDSLLYTDGISMWKTENSFSARDIKFYKLFVRHIKDFVRYGDQILCTTYSKLFYTFSIEDEISFIKSVPVDEYCSAEKLFNNTEYLYRVLEEVDKNNELSNKIKIEGNYITALSLSNRQDIMDTVIKHYVTVYEKFENVHLENADVTLTEEMHEYFKPESWYFLIKLTASIVENVNTITMSNLFDDITIHVSLSSEKRLLKTMSIQLKEPLKKFKMLIPLNSTALSSASHIIVEIILVTSIPGSLDEKQAIWVTLFRKLVVLSSEHFIKSNTATNKYICFKQPEEKIEGQILKLANHQHGYLFKFTDLTMNKTDNNDWTFYVKLPENYKQVLKINECYKAMFGSKKAGYLLKQLSVDEFLKSNSNLIFDIFNVSVKLEIVIDFSNPLLKITSKNAMIAFNIRNFLAYVIRNGYTGYGPGKEFVTNAFYTTTENLYKAVKESITSGTQEELLSLAEEFQKTVIGALPL